jgi:hypothetical protein
MREFLNESRSKYHLGLGEYSFSPVMEASIALSLLYREIHLEEKQKQPFFLSFPDKNQATIWLSLSLLVNFFFEDYINQTNEKFKIGNNVIYFNTIAKVENVSDIEIKLRFGCGTALFVQKKDWPQLSLDSSDRPIDKYSRLLRYKEKLRNNGRSPISKILEPKDFININEEKLLSKVLLITGRGNVKQYKNILKTYCIYDESLNKIFIDDKNIILKKDLDQFKNIFDTKIPENAQLFKEVFLDFINDSIESDSELSILVKKLLENDEFLTTYFKDTFDDLIDNYREFFPELENLISLYPGVKEEIPKNLRAVIINEAEQIVIYKDTIQGFLNAGIPVIVISDRFIQNIKDFTLLKDYFAENPNVYRINWNRSKINSLKETENQEFKYLDSHLWKNCLRYSNQKIRINVSESCYLDKLLFESQKVIRDLDDFESIQEAYYKYLYPASYLFKNSSKNSKSVIDLVELFNKEFLDIKFYLDKSVQGILQKMIDFLGGASNNTKSIDHNSIKTFSNLLPVNLGQNVFIPSEFDFINISNNNTESIIFSGYPFNEFSGKYLFNSVCRDFVPDIEISCWPIESDLTYNYLKRRILAGYFTDNLPSKCKISKLLTLNSNQNFTDEIDSFLLHNNFVGENNIPESGDQENDIVAVTNLKYKGYSTLSDDGSSYRVKCDILNFNDGSFLFLPKNSRVLAQIETDDGSIKLRNSLFSDLEIGFTIYKYRVDRKDRRESAKNDLTIKNAFTELELWKSELVKIYNENNCDIEKVEDFLLSVKRVNNLETGNPLKYNIQRWLYDDDLIAPTSDNIRIILLGSGQSEIETTLTNIEKAKRKVVRYTISLSSKIKKSISKKIETQFLNNETRFEIDFSNIQIDVESRIITSLEKNEIEIDYYNTRKILI